MRKEIKTRIEMISRGEVPEGYKQTKVGIIPEDWEVKRLGEIAEIGSSKRIMAHEYVPEGIPFYRSKEIIEKSLGNKIEERLYISRERYQEIASQFPIPQEGEILITAVGTLGIPYLIRRRDLPFYFKDGNLIWFREIQDVNKEYLIYLWLSEAIIRQIENTFSGSSQKALTIEKVNKLKFPNAPLPEQQKIAQILSTWDQAIELKEKLIEEKKQQKKGLMQKLLTGEVRLPGFDGEWEEKELKDICKLETGKRPKGGANEIGEIPSLGGENINNDNGLNLNNIRKISNEFYNSMKQGKLKENDILINKDGANTGKVALYKNVGLEKAAINEHLFIVRPKNKNIDYKFLYYYLASPEAKNKISVRITSSAQPGLNSKFVNGFYLSIPLYNEQIRIGNILYTADKEIDLLNQELEQLKLQKKGLMQLLLTGIIRVKS